jgi:hypothetical protein
MRILQNSQEIVLTEALAVPAQQLSRGCAHLTGTHAAASLSNGAANEIERFIARESQTTGSDLVSIGRSCRGDK